ncbi:MAG: ABC transporter permease [Chloroflexota bacterium]|nr:ABC transporter permease [Chloroflexota bacterium]
MIGTLIWRPFPILALTIRQFLGGKAVRVTVALALIPCAFAGIYRLNTDVATARAFLTDAIFLNLMAPTLLPIVVLILATAALGNEVEDRTLPYLTLKPISRLRIVLEKFVGVLVVVIPAVSAGLALSYLIVVGGDLGAPSEILWAMIAASAFGAISSAAIFIAVSLIIPRALLTGIIYTFVWESLLGRYLPGVRAVSVRHYTQSIFVQLLDSPSVTINSVTSLRASLLTVLGIVIASVALATWRLRRMNQE